MATVITSECINCGACEPECPNTAIYQGGVEWELNGQMNPAVSDEIFYIVPEKCTECVGFHDHEACAAVCPVDCCIPDPNIPESEDVLIARAKQLHPETDFGAEFPSRFKTGDGSATPAPADAASAPATPAPTPAAAPAAPAPAPAAATLALPSVEDWEVPVECFRCHGTYGVAFRHFRSGVVFYCPFCTGSLVVTRQMHQTLAEKLRRFHAQWAREFEAFQEKRQKDLDEFEERQREALELFNRSLTGVSPETRPPGAPRKRAGIFG